MSWLSRVSFTGCEQRIYKKIWPVVAGGAPEPTFYCCIDLQPCMVIIILIGSPNRSSIQNIMSEVSFESKITFTVLNAGAIAVNYIKWSAAWRFARCRETPPLFIATHLAPAGPLWPKVFGGPKNPGRWPRGSTDEAQSSLWKWQWKRDWSWHALACPLLARQGETRLMLVWALHRSVLCFKIITYRAEVRLLWGDCLIEFFSSHLLSILKCRLRIRSVLSPTFSFSSFLIHTYFINAHKQVHFLFAAAHYLSSKQTVARFCNHILSHLSVQPDLFL